MVIIFFGHAPEDRKGWCEAWWGPYAYDGLCVGEEGRTPFFSASLTHHRCAELVSNDGTWCFLGWWRIRAAGRLVGEFRGPFESPIMVEDW